MWNDVGVLRHRSGLDRAIEALAEIEAELLETGLPDGNRVFNLTWHDWLNLRSLTETSRVIALAARQRENSRGAHFREDFPDPGQLPTSTFTVARQQNGEIAIVDKPVEFTIVRPGETLLKENAAAE
jgi:fumarate reductase flavoprotein subunit